MIFNAMTTNMFFLVAIFYYLTFATQSVIGEMTVTVLHTNDVHSRFLETNKHSGGCTPEDQKRKACFGGFARLHYKVNDRSIFNVTLFNANLYR